ncbi:protein-L-isoaspartate(D-aspartate) O-methyltransferase [Chroococcidiopsis sp. TS-821]|uniref:protein-L-isoaspartate(D-aspartate) O-methyltransferase n=1 Tax=Chroococcidiopsis sp. TS-821 TaxID=1378066 RepID=UPI000CEEFFA2|nr:protein-L-isoaspartate(D-aspartate) O-methyltransferase [Chroococcidiopsis sp. TS-821]PPS40951.1 protein-L-isoaspartate(D-aspartate) O-methyltransferase [Chroococcidiopsis sp. TS-821]
MYVDYLNQMVNKLKEQRAIHSIEVENAFRKVQRHRLLETFYLPGDLQPIAHNPYNPNPEHLDLIYSGNSLVTRTSDGKPSSSTSEPMLIAYMLELLALTPGLKVLEIGAGTGYNAALIAELVGDQTLVVSVDVQEDVIVQTQRLLADAGYPDIILVLRDGFYGVQEKAPYERIVATVGCKDISPYWVDQLSPSGFMLLPLTHGGWTPLVKVWLQEGTLQGKIVGFSGFMLFEYQESVDDPWYISAIASLGLEEAEELPVFEGIEVEHTRSPLMWSAFPVSFYYFMAMKDCRAFWSLTPPGYGLYDPQRDTILIYPQKNCILLKGDRELYKQLQTIYEAWTQLGKPSPFDYTIEFVPRTQVMSSPQPSWVIERKFYRQVLSLCEH